MAAVRTLVVTVPPLLGELVTSLCQPYLPMDVVGVLQSRALLAEQLRAMAPDLVLLGLQGAETDDAALPLLRALPTATILVLAPNGQHAWLHTLRTHRLVLADLSAPALIEALKSRFAPPPPQG